ncbi:salicylate carboxymethyltransferase-like protein [Tanacetum coccineum]
MADCDMLVKHLAGRTSSVRRLIEGEESDCDSQQARPLLLKLCQERGKEEGLCCSAEGSLIPNFHNKSSFLRKALLWVKASSKRLVFGHLVEPGTCASSMLLCTVSSTEHKALRRLLEELFLGDMLVSWMSRNKTDCNIFSKVEYVLYLQSCASSHKVVRLGINPMIQPEPEDLPKDNPKLEIAVLRLCARFCPVAEHQLTHGLLCSYYMFMCCMSYDVVLVSPTLWIRNQESGIGDNIPLRDYKMNFVVWIGVCVRDMDVSQVLRMNGGDGDYSYSNNSLLQREVISMTKPIIEDALMNLYCDMNFPKTLIMADLGCSSGPNTFLVASELVKSIDKIRLELGHDESPEIQIYLNDLPHNDFNTIFLSVSDFIKNLAKQTRVTKSSSKTPCYFSGVPGSFYTRLFLKHSVHFVHSSYSLMWLSQVGSLSSI